MTEQQSGYTPEQALARDLIATAVNGSINHWARVHGYLIDCPPAAVRAEGIDIRDRSAALGQRERARSVWSADLVDITRAITKLIDAPQDCADPGSGIDAGLLRTVSHALHDARTRQLSRVADLIADPAAAPDHDRGEFERMVADVVFQVAVAAQVIY